MRGFPAEVDAATVEGNNGGNAPLAEAVSLRRPCRASGIACDWITRSGRGPVFMWQSPLFRGGQDLNICRLFKDSATDVPLHDQ